MRKVILLVEHSSSYGRGLLYGITEYSRIHGPWTFFREPEAPFYRSSSQTVSLARLKKLNADGIVTRLARNTRAIKSLGIPMIATDDNRRTNDFPTIISDCETIGKMAAEHLLNLRFRHFGYCGFSRIIWSKERHESFEKTINKAGFKVHTYKPPQKKEQKLWENEQHVMAEWLKSLPKPIGIMASNDDRGQQVIEVCRMHGIYVPEEVAVIGVDNDLILCGLSNPQLSSVAVDTVTAGYNAARLLDKLMSGDINSPQTVVARPTHIEVRQSTDTLVTNDKLVREAVNYIKRNSKKAIQVQDVAAYVGVSRRMLLDRFSNVLGRTVHEEIKRVRVERIARMLLETDMPIYQIALELDFTSVEHIARYFRQGKNMSPLEYRNTYGRSFKGNHGHAL